MKALLSVDAIVINDHDGERNTLLHLAARHGHHMALSILLDRGANLEERNTDGSTPLYSAAKRGHLKCCGRLITRGADINVKCTVRNVMKPLIIQNHEESLF